VLRQPLLDPKLGRAWVALANGKPVGYLLVVFVFSLEQGGLTAEIDEIFVAPEHRDRELGARLLQTAEEGCRNAGCSSIALQLGRGNESARRFYLRKGYSERVYDLLDKGLA
jgi:GNAT superfamily N-acetyltransferase